MSNNGPSLGGKDKQKYRDEAEAFMKQACREAGIPAGEYMKVARMFKELEGHHLGESMFHAKANMREAVNLLVPDEPTGDEPGLGNNGVTEAIAAIRIQTLREGMCELCDGKLFADGTCSDTDCENYEHYRE